MEKILIVKVLLIIIGTVGAVDEYFYHYKKAQLLFKPECLTENILHILRQFSFSIIFFLSACVDLHGYFALALMILLVIDIIIGFADVIVEPKSRKQSGGLPAGEYFLHMLLSFSLGIFHFNYISYLLPKIANSSSYALNLEANSPLQIALISMSMASLFIAIAGIYAITRKK
jgi:hypothetical protein